MLLLAGAGWILAAAVMALLWLWHLRLPNAGMVDAGIRKDLRLDAQAMASSGEKQ